MKLQPSAAHQLAQTYFKTPELKALVLNAPYPERDDTHGSAMERAEATLLGGITHVLLLCQSDQPDIREQCQSIAKHCHKLMDRRDQGVAMGFIPAVRTGIFS